jgi:hypothetical protein
MFFPVAGTAAFIREVARRKRTASAMGLVWPPASSRAGTPKTRQPGGKWGNIDGIYGIYMGYIYINKYINKYILLSHRHIYIEISHIYIVCFLGYMWYIYIQLTLMIFNKHDLRMFNRHMRIDKYTE